MPKQIRNCDKKLLFYPEPAIKSILLQSRTGKSRLVGCSPTRTPWSTTHEAQPEMLSLAAAAAASDPTCYDTSTSAEGPRARHTSHDPPSLSSALTAPVDATLRMTLPRARRNSPLPSTPLCGRDMRMPQLRQGAQVCLDQLRGHARGQRLPADALDGWVSGRLLARGRLLRRHR